MNKDGHKVFMSDIEFKTTKLMNWNCIDVEKIKKKQKQKSIRNKWEIRCVYKILISITRINDS